METRTSYKMIFFVFNIVYLAIGVVMLGFGIYSVIEMNKYGNFSQNSFIAGACIFIAVGVFKIIFSIVGMIATFVNSKILHGVYVSVLVFLMFWTFIAAIYGFLARPSAWEITRDRLTQAYLPGSNFTADIATVQTNFDCCGVDGPAGIVVPCNTTRTVQDVFGQGCLRQLGLFFVEELYQVGAIGMAFGVTEITALLIAMQNTQGLF